MAVKLKGSGTRKYGRNKKFCEAYRAGSKNGGNVLVEADVLNIRRAAQAGTKQKFLAAEYGVSHCTISQVVSRRTWRHI